MRLPLSMNFFRLLLFFCLFFFLFHLFFLTYILEYFIKQKIMRNDESLEYIIKYYNFDYF